MTAYAQSRPNGLAALGRIAIAVAEDVGGVALVGWATLRRLWPPRADAAELWRSLYAFGLASMPIVIAVAAFTGMIMVLQAAVYVRQYGAYDLVGWFAGFATFREAGPVLIGLIFSGRVGAGHTSELATMRVTEQLDALRVLAVDVYDVIVLPRVIAMVIAHAALVVFGDLAAVLVGALCAQVFIGVDPWQFGHSLVTGLVPGDVFIGIAKGAGFGFAIGIVSTHFGLSASGGSRGVGRAVNAQVVGCAAALFVVDYILTMLAR